MLMGVAVATVLGAASCKKSVIPAAKGDSVLFSAGLGGSESGTKTIYTDSNASDRRNAENINWLSGDQIRIWCAECSEPTAEGYGGMDHCADYTVTPESTATQGKIAVNPGTVGLRWGEPETTHCFYAVYPSPNTTGKGSDTGTFGTDPVFKFTGHIPAKQTISGSLTPTGPDTEGKTTTVAAPDMSNLYMVTEPTSASPGTGGEGVFLSFRPISTAIQFTIENAMTAEGAKMQVESVKIMSDPKTGTPKNISGAFEANLSGTWTKPVIASIPAGSGIISEYINDYPACTEPADATGQSSALTIDFKNTTAYTEGIAKGGRLQFTFFLLPTQSVDDLSFVITRKEGESGTKTIKTRLAMADGTGIPFPVHKKTYVKGILVPDGAQWVIQYSLDVNPWGDNPTDLPFFYPEGSQTTTVTPWGGEHSEGVPFFYPEGSEISTVTTWEDVECDPGFEKQS